MSKDDKKMDDKIASNELEALGLGKKKQTVTTTYRGGDYGGGYGGYGRGYSSDYGYGGRSATRTTRDRDLFDSHDPYYRPLDGRGRRDDFGDGLELPSFMDRKRNVDDRTDSYLAKPFSRESATYGKDAVVEKMRGIAARAWATREGDAHAYIRADSITALAKVIADDMLNIAEAGCFAVTSAGQQKLRNLVRDFLMKECRMTNGAMIRYITVIDEDGVVESNDDMPKSDEL